MMHAQQVMPRVIRQAAASQGGLLRMESIFVRGQSICVSVSVGLSVSNFVLLDIQGLEYS